MTRNEGHATLNKARDGQKVDDEQITAALIATGDLAGWRETHVVGSLAAGVRSQGVDQAAQTASQGTGPTRSGRLVAANEGSHTEIAWSGWSKYLDCRHE